MKIRLITLTIILLVFTGCSITKADPTSMTNVDDNEVNSTNTENLTNSEKTTEATEEVANKSTEVKDSSTESTSNEPNENTTIGKEVNETPINQTPFVVTTDDINGYHELITDVSSLNLNLDLSDPRLKNLLEHLSEYTYNMATHQIGEVSVPDSLYVLTNKLNHLPENYTPETLRVPDIRFSIKDYDEKKNQREEPALGLEAMFADAEAEFHYLYAVSGYRSYNRQQTIYNYNVDTRGVEQTDKVSARPGHSEHQTGLAMDISCEAVGFGLEYEFGATEEGKWIASNAHNYGFIIRYPETKVDITGYNYEPWHLRYVGKDLASFIYDYQLTLEELYSSIFNQLK